jgi:hypothetical protein
MEEDAELAELEAELWDADEVEAEEVAVVGELVVVVVELP